MSLSRVAVTASPRSDPRLALEAQSTESGPKFLTPKWPIVVKNSRPQKCPTQTLVFGRFTCYTTSTQSKWRGRAVGDSYENWGGRGKTGRRHRKAAQRSLLWQQVNRRPMDRGRGLGG